MVAGQEKRPGLLIFRNSNGSGKDGCMTYEYAKAYMNDAVWIDCRIEETSQDR